MFRPPQSVFPAFCCVRGRLVSPCRGRKKLTGSSPERVFIISRFKARRNQYHKSSALCTYYTLAPIIDVTFLGDTCPTLCLCTLRHVCACVFFERGGGQKCHLTDRSRTQRPPRAAVRPELPINDMMFYDVCVENTRCYCSALLMCSFTLRGHVCVYTKSTKKA